jgi:hypothetical protein
MRTVLANVALLHSCLLHWAITTGLGQQRVALESSGIECFAMMARSRPIFEQLTMSMASTFSFI